VASAFSPLGFTAHRQPGESPAIAPHLFLHRPGSSDKLLLLVSHLDTVYPASEIAAEGFSWREAGDRIYGPGIYDIKGGTLMALLLMQALQALDPDTFARCHWLIALNAAEEILNHGFAQACLAACPYPPSAALVFEGDDEPDPSRQSTLITHRKGRTLFRLTAHGHGAHAGAEHDKGCNAVRQLARLVEPLEALTASRPDLTLNVGPFIGGSAPNRVPHLASLECEMRAPHQRDLDATEAVIRDLVQNTPFLQSKDGRATASLNLEILQKDPAWDPSNASENLATHWISAGNELGTRVTTSGRGGLSDANFLSAHTPTLDGLGPSGGNAHSSQSSGPPNPKRPEYLLPASFLPKLRLNAHALRILSHSL
jgi:glutamate carboxypeptidase